MHWKCRRFVRQLWIIIMPVEGCTIPIVHNTLTFCLMSPDYMSSLMIPYDWLTEIFKDTPSAAEGLGIQNGIKWLNLHFNNMKTRGGYPTRGGTWIKIASRMNYLCSCNRFVIAFSTRSTGFCALERSANCS